MLQRAAPDSRVTNVRRATRRESKVGAAPASAIVTASATRRESAIASVIPPGAAMRYDQSDASVATARPANSSTTPSPRSRLVPASPTVDAASARPASQSESPTSVRKSPSTCVRRTRALAPAPEMIALTSAGTAVPGKRAPESAAAHCPFSDTVRRGEPEKSAGSRTVRCEPARSQAARAVAPASGDSMGCRDLIERAPVATVATTPAALSTSRRVTTTGRDSRSEIRSAIPGDRTPTGNVFAAMAAALRRSVLMTRTSSHMEGARANWTRRNGSEGEVPRRPQRRQRLPPHPPNATPRRPQGACLRICALDGSRRRGNAWRCVCGRIC